jgi:hypothetical protein
MTDKVRQNLENYLRVGRLVEFMKAKALLSLKAIGHQHQRPWHRDCIHPILDIVGNRRPTRVGRHRVGATQRDNCATQTVDCSPPFRRQIPIGWQSPARQWPP